LLKADHRKVEDLFEQYQEARSSDRKAALEHYVKEEERRPEGMFAQAKAAGLDVVALGAKLAQRKQELLAQIKANGLPSPRHGALPGTRSSRKARLRLRQRPDSSGGRELSRPPSLSWINVEPPYGDKPSYCQ
jgi:hypothetical protein